MAPRYVDCPSVKALMAGICSPARFNRVECDERRPAGPVDDVVAGIGT